MKPAARIVLPPLRRRQAPRKTATRKNLTRAEKAIRILSGSLTAHPLTVRYLVAACLRPGMYMVDYELGRLEAQLHAYDVALADVGKMKRYIRLNDVLAGWIERRNRQSMCQGWSAALERRYGPGEPAFKALVSVVKKKLQAPGSEKL